jgi:hypothetical protein
MAFSLSLMVRERERDREEFKVFPLLSSSSFRLLATRLDMARRRISIIAMIYGEEAASQVVSLQRQILNLEFDAITFPRVHESYKFPSQLGERMSK